MWIKDSARRFTANAMHGKLGPAHVLLTRLPLKSHRLGESHRGSQVVDVVHPCFKSSSLFNEQLFSEVHSCAPQAEAADVTALKSKPEGEPLKVCSCHYDDVVVVGSARSVVD